MGSCLGCAQSDGEKQNTTIARQLDRDKKTGNKVKKILFLGSGGSGKSTIFKQLRGIYGTGFNNQERKVFVSHIHEQVITQMKLALEILEEYRAGDLDGILHQNEIKYIDKTGMYTNDIKEDIEDDIEYDDDYNEDDFDGTIPELSESGQEAAAFLTDIHYTSYKLNDEIVNALKCLWYEPAIQKMYEMRNITKIVDSSAYFWDKLDSLNTPNYVPDEADILLVRYRTTGATEEKYEMPDGKGSFSIIDVGGQKSERKKWIKCFDNVTAVIFVASLSCYDEVLYEDYSTNSMTDQLELFDDICNNEALKETSMILFLNKKDLFADKINKVPLGKCFSFADYTGPKDSFDKTTKYIRKAFTSLNNMPNRKNIFTHITCATDQDNIQKVFADVQHIVIEASLIQAGLMDWDDNQRYKSVDNSNKQEENNNNAEYNDPQTAQRIRDSIMTSNQRKQQSYNYMGYMGYGGKGGISTMSTVSAGYNSNFRDIIKKKSYPQLDRVEYSGVLMEYDYDDLDKNSGKFCDDSGLLNGRYCWGESFKVFGKKKTLETFMILDLEPNIDIHKSMDKKNINLCIVLDLGRAMNNDFDDGQKKMDAVREMIIYIIKNELSELDRLAIVTFGMQAKVIQEINDMNNININSLCNIIKNIECETRSLDSQRVDFSGYQFGVNQFRKLATQNKDMNGYMNRMFMITSTRLSQQILTECGEVSTKGYCYSTFIGISNRFSLQRTILSDINGCNYFNINSSEQLKEKILNRFEEVVTPVMFDLNVILNVNSGDKCVESIYRLNGEDENDEINIRGNSNKVLSVKTLFLRKQKYENIPDDDDRLDRNVNNRHLLLIKLQNNCYDYELMIGYRDYKGQYLKTPVNISFQKSANNTTPSEEHKDDALLKSTDNINNNNIEEYYDNNSIRKAILLMRYIRILREWLNNSPRNGKTSVAKVGYVTNEFQKKFQQFYNYFKNQSKFINDDKSLNKEINVLSSLTNT